MTACPTAGQAVPSTATSSFTIFLLPPGPKIYLSMEVSRNPLSQATQHSKSLLLLGLGAEVSVGFLTAISVVFGHGHRTVSSSLILAINPSTLCRNHSPLQIWEFMCFVGTTVQATQAD